MFRGGKATVLVVDDEPLLRLDLAGILIAKGYQILEAGNAAEALAALATYSDIDVLFTDVQMPGSMDGLALARYVSEFLPLIIIVICSGNRQPEQFDMPQGSYFLAKPVEQGQLEVIISAIEVRLV